MNCKQAPSLGERAAPWSGSSLQRSGLMQLAGQSQRPEGACPASGPAWREPGP